MNECPSCGVSWEGKEIPDGLYAASNGVVSYNDAQNTARNCYGWTPENKKRFSKNVVLVKSLNGHNEYTRCCACKARFDVNMKEIV